MRDIKFRAWLDYGDGSGEMLPNIQNHINGSWAFGHVVNGSVDNVSEPMQYTGLKDKNGVEIYEGDILALDNNDERSSYYTYKVIYVEDKAKFMCKSVCDCEMNDILVVVNHYDSSGKYEVIGNTHQNPELLK